MTKGIQVIWKITNHCNFACKYCHYSDEMNSKPDTMDLELAELFIKRISDSSIYQRVNFIFHGGEPLTVGLDYYERIVSFQKRYLKGKTYSNSFQTNGSLINKELVQFAKKNKISFSISLDGPKEIHDANRVFKNGVNTHDTIMKNLKFLNDNNQNFSILTVYSELMKDSDEIFSFFKSMDGLTEIDFLPMRATRETAFQMNYGHFLMNIFDKWFNDPECKFDIRTLSMMTKSLIGLLSSLCHFREVCVIQSNILTLDPYGNAYPCDNDTYSKFLLGNIQTNKLDDLMGNHPVRIILANLEIKRNKACGFCEWYSQCQGGCPDHYDVITKQNAYCSDYKNILQHIQNTLKEYLILDDHGNVKIDNIDKIPNKSLINTIKKHYSYNLLKKSVHSC
jgi:uncharacterized protein